MPPTVPPLPDSLLDAGVAGTCPVLADDEDPDCPIGSAACVLPAGHDPELHVFEAAVSCPPVGLVSRVTSAMLREAAQVQLGEPASPVDTLQQRFDDVRRAYEHGSGQ